jgi:hypothetical protein
MRCSPKADGAIIPAVIADADRRKKFRLVIIFVVVLEINK